MDTDTPLILVILQSFVTQVGGYLAVVGLLFLIFWVWGERRFAARRVQKRKRFTGKQLRHELLHTLITFVVSLASVGVLLVLHSMGRTRLVDVQAPGQTLALVLWIGGLIVFNDVWFYGWHRLLHTPWLFRHVHAVHHKSVDVNPFSSYSFHAFEGFILGAWIIPAAIWLPIPMAALGVVQVIGLMNNVNSHLGYELLPAWWVRVPPFKWTASSTYHNLHHQRLNGNYALFFRWLDRAFGSEVVGYEAAFCDRSAPQQDPPGDARV
ncbi:sterol desaturase family protein [Nannocystis sp.]|uniref:sterol desaturase family protein n=1 Tax=Nannocystis sp. TaxID=1962667 RepID=UPI0025E10BA5|nr:sterol desaturase family protein [Nannocystis sp.]MBK7829774.1 sterol desaturase family protein [Nannocystis sp.]